MASFPVSSALRKQSAAIPLSLHASQFLASPRTCSSSFSTLCPKARSIHSRKSRSISGISAISRLSSIGTPKKKITPNSPPDLFTDIPPGHPIQSSQRFNSAALPTQQRRTFLVQLKRQAQTLKEAASPAPEEPPVTSEPAKLQLKNLPYFIRRTASNQLPIYLVTKAGGTKQQTKIQKTEGDMDALKNDLALYLDARSPKSAEVTVNRLNGHIIVKVRVHRSLSICHMQLVQKPNPIHRDGGNPRSSNSFWSGTSNQSPPLATNFDP